MRIINVSDLHICSNKNAMDYYEEISQICKYIDNMYMKNEKLDILVFNGDFFEEFYYANSPEMMMASLFITDLYRRAYTYGFNIFFLKGTYSHGDSQLSLFRPIFGDRVFFIEDVTFVEYGEYVIRFIPEYYSDNYEELRAKAFDKMADITFLHGTIEGCGIFAKSIGASQVKNAQVILVSDLKSTTELFTVAGHIHNRKEVVQDIWYTGSFTSSSFSDANTKKGFDDITVENGSYKVKHVVNKQARRYHIYDASEAIKQTLPKARVYFNEMKMAITDLDVVRIDVNCNGYTEDNMNNLNILRSQFKDTFQFKINRDVAQVVATKNILEDAERVLSPTISIVDKIAWSINEEYKKDMDISRIREILDLPELCS